jgi:hypothetical protein
MSGYTLRAGQRGKTLRIATGIDLSDAEARIVRIRREDDDVLTVTGVPYDPDSVGDLLLLIEPDQFDLSGVYALEVEIQQSGGIVLKYDKDITINVVDINVPEEEDE